MTVKTTDFFQPINSRNIGALMREVVRRMCATIHRQRFSFAFEGKEVDYKVGADFVSTADKEAQLIALDFLKRNFPEFGIIAEEDDLFKDAKEFHHTDGSIHKFFFSLDPLDGTKAFIRKQSDSYSSMISFIHEINGVATVIGVCIGDPMTGEMYYTRPDSPRVHLLDRDTELARLLCFDKEMNPSETFALLREPLYDFSPIIRKLVNEHGLDRDNFFLKAENVGGSIGISFAKLWKGQYGMLALKAGKTTVWDSAPCIGISAKLGFVPMIVNKQGRLEKSKFFIHTKRENMEQHETIIVHKTLVSRIIEWQKETLML
jgi:fructose-1,6-bisphosphatase/inositol monophosphatase family enzyme